MLRVLLAFMCLAIGLVTAWGIAAVGVDERVTTVATSQRIDGPSAGAGLLADQLSVVGYPGIDRACIDGMKYSQWRAWALKFDARGGGMTIHSFRALGWPMRCFVTRDDYPLNGFVGPGDYDGARHRFSSWLDRFVDVPVTPVWPAFVANGAFFGAFWFLMIAGALRAFKTTVWRVRVRRGRCPDCSFPRLGLPTHAPCPECGQPAPERHSFVNEPFPAP